MEYAFMAGGSDACASVRLTRYKQGESPRKNRANCRGIEKLEALHTRGHDAVDRPPPPDQNSSKSQSQKASENHENTFCVKNDPAEAGPIRDAITFIRMQSFILDRTSR
ncbi:MAG TPA: hypothetical protein VF051_11925 [Hyphomicrobiaceae bacterium]